MVSQQVQRYLPRFPLASSALNTLPVPAAIWLSSWSCTPGIDWTERLLPQFLPCDQLWQLVERYHSFLSPLISSSIVSHQAVHSYILRMIIYVPSRPHTQDTLRSNLDRDVLHPRCNCTLNIDTCYHVLNFLYPIIWICQERRKNKSMSGAG